MIRKATPRDLATLARMGEKFIETTGYKGRLPFNSDTFATRLFPLTQSDDAHIVLWEDEWNIWGAIGLAIAPDLYTEDRKALELFWWVEPAARGRGIGADLLAEAIRWALEKKVASLGMVEPPNAPDIAKLYERRGFERLETTWELKLWQPSQV